MKLPKHAFDVTDEKLRVPGYPVPISGLKDLSTIEAAALDGESLVGLSFCLMALCMVRVFKSLLSAESDRLSSALNT